MREVSKVLSQGLLGKLFHSQACVSQEGEKNLEKEFTPGLKLSTASDIEDLLSETSMPNTSGCGEELSALEEKSNYLCSSQ